MSLSPVLTFTDPTKFPPLLRLNDGVKKPEIRRVMGRAIGREMRNNFRKLDASRANHLGGDRTHFYGRAVKAVQQPELAGGDGVKVAVNMIGIAQRYFGGPIVAKPGKKLTIPVNAEAYGHRAREFTDLHPIYFQNGDGVLVRDDTESPNNIGEIFFRLLKRVNQKPDPEVLPTQEVLTAAALQAGEGHMATLIDRAKS